MMMMMMMMLKGTDQVRHVWAASVPICKLLKHASIFLLFLWICAKLECKRLCCQVKLQHKHVPFLALWHV